MSLTTKYSCGCTSTSNTKCLGDDSCCKESVQTAPAPCCESHTKVYQFSTCLYVTCAITSTADTPFFLTFCNMDDCGVPMNAAEVFFYHQSAGLMQIRSYNGNSYEVDLVDPTKAGAIIAPEDCVLVSVQPQSGVFNSTTRCLCGKFVAPAIGETETMYIFNGTGIPIGSTLTLTGGGETGSYQVTEFISATGNTYAYKVLNAGQGHTPGLILDGGDSGECLIPIELITDVDLCSLSESNTADQIVVCKDGTPRAFVPSSPGDVPYGEDDGTWGTRQILNVDCCLVTDGCLKFSDSGGLAASDSVVVKDVNIDCFTEAWDAAQLSGSSLLVIIDGETYTVDNWDEGTKTITLSPANLDFLNDGEPFIEYPDGTNICLGECCLSCNEGDSFTDHKSFGGGDPERSALFTVNVEAVPYDAGVINYFLIGFDQAGAQTFIQLDATWKNDPDPTGARKPTHEDPLLLREKICNPSDCDKHVEIEINHENKISGLPADVRFIYDLGHFVFTSATMVDDTTPADPGCGISSQSADAGVLVGPTFDDADITVQSSLGPGNFGDSKIYPYIAGAFKDYASIPKFCCANSILWYFVILDGSAYAGSPGTIDMGITFRRWLRFKNLNFVTIPKNDPDLEGFAS